MNRRAAVVLAIWAVFVVRGFFYAAALPVWEGFDEFSHFAYIQYVLTLRSLPQTDTPLPVEVDRSLNVAPLPRLLPGFTPSSATHDQYWRLPEQERSRREAEFARLRSGAYEPGSSGLHIHEAQQPPLFYWLLAPLMKLLAGCGLGTQVLLLRWAAVLIASLTVPLGFLLCREVFSDDRVAFGIVAVASLMPVLMFDVARVSNDCLGAPLFTLLIYLALRWQQRRSSSPFATSNPSQSTLAHTAPAAGLLECGGLPLPLCGTEARFGAEAAVPGGKPPRRSAAASDRTPKISGRGNCGAVEAVSLGLVLGAALLSKAYFIPALPVLALLFGWEAVRRPGERLRVVANAALAFVVAAAVAGWWYWRNYQLTGSWAAEVNFVATSHLSIAEFLRTSLRINWRNALDSTLTSHIWCGGWSFLGVRGWMYHLFEYVALAACLGLLIALFRAVKNWGDCGLRIAGCGFQATAGLADCGFQATAGGWRAEPLLALVAFYGFFWLALAYHVVATFLNFGSGSTTGWYMCCLIVVEVALVYAGLANLVEMAAKLRPAPGRDRWEAGIQRYILPGAAAAFTLLEMYSTHFVLLPYYAGLIRHRPNGGLEAFHVSSLLQLGLGETLRRLTINRGPVGSAAFLLLWLAFVTATLGVVASLFRLSRSSGKATAMPILGAQKR